MQEKALPQDDESRRIVYIVYGHETVTISNIVNFVKNLGLEILKKEAAIDMIEDVSPFIGRIIDVAFEHAQAVMILLTGDEEARLCKEFQHSDEEEIEKNFYLQPTQEQIFEAGYAFGRSPKRTILIQIGPVKPFSDIIGRHMLSFTEAAGDYAQLRILLKRAGCLLNDD